MTIEFKAEGSTSISDFSPAVKKGVRRLTSIVFWQVILLFFLWFILAPMFIYNPVMNYFQIGWDSTDGIETRSQMEALIDYGTGCEYLRSDNGGLTPRLDPQGQHMCGAVEKL